VGTCIEIVGYPQSANYARPILGLKTLMGIYHITVMSIECYILGCESMFQRNVSPPSSEVLFF
jgi:hypothetical protein